MPTVARLSITPVKSLLLHHPEEILLEPFGVAADRRFYLIREDGRLLAGLHHGPLALVRADWEPEHRPPHARPSRTGRSSTADVALGEQVLTDFWGHRVEGRLVEGPWAEALSRSPGGRSGSSRRTSPAGAVDVEPLTLVSSESVAELARRVGLATRGRAAASACCFEIDGCDPHEEDTWAGRHVRIGEAVIEIGGPVPRCATTTRDPDTGKRDLDTLREIAAYRGKRDGKKIDFGVYASVVGPGRVRVGDALEPG